MSGMKVVSVSPLDWPSSESELPTGKIQCGTLSYQFYNARKTNKIQMDYYSQYKTKEGGGDEKGLHENENAENVSQILKSKNGKGGKKADIDLKTLTPKQLDKLSYYDILGGIQMHSTKEQIKKAFHRACLKYHPDKEEATKKDTPNDENKDSTKEGESDTKKKGEDPLFLKVKEAFETLSDPKLRKSYDSTVDFDDKIPSSSDIRSDRDFYAVFGVCFERNLRFAAENEPGLNKNNSTDISNGANKKGKRKNGKNGKSKTDSSSGPPKLGNANTSIEGVNQFYDFWVRFESWRDFTLPATKELEHDTDMAECRFEKRWMEKEIARKAKTLKRKEMERITKLVDRAMALDPRLKREKKRLEEEKMEKQRLKKEQKEKEEKERKEKEEKEEKERLEREETEKQQKAKMKILKEQGKKVLRKAKQSLRKAVLEGYEADSSAWNSFEDMNDDLEFLCSWLSAEELRELTEDLAKADMTFIREKAKELRIGAADKSKEDIKKREAMRQAAAEKEAALKAARAPKEWTKEELSALAKGVKKYPPGGANRWDQIAHFLNNLCRQPDPRTKEECIEKYNAFASKALPTASTSATSKSKSGSKAASEKESSDSTLADWSEEQDKQLQEGLSKFPSSMEKNERWKAIANRVTGKSKKECVQRFKAIREALKKK